jgi:dipeptidyl aminopeptidase/acylaminoacyl peptidase
LYVAAVSGNQLTAINRRGVTQWTLARPNISEPRWYSPSGYRIAYLSAGNLRVIAGDGNGDHLIASDVAHVAPAWRPAHAYQLAYLTRGGALVVRDGDTGRMLWSRPAGPAVTELEWSADGRYLVAVSPAIGRLYGASGTLISKIAPPAGTSVIDGALSPNGRLLALVLGGTSQQVVLADIPGRKAVPRRVLAGPGLRQVMWSPDSRWLLVSWPEADQLVFVRVVGTPRIAAVSHIAQQFSAGGHSAFPLLQGWCCTAPRSGG